jgi:hypothetical protein
VKQTHRKDNAVAAAESAIVGSRWMFRVTGRRSIAEPLIRVPDNACVIDPQNDEEVLELLREHGTFELLPGILDILLHKLDEQIKEKLIGTGKEL